MTEAHKLLPHVPQLVLFDCVTRTLLPNMVEKIAKQILDLDLPCG